MRLNFRQGLVSSEIDTDGNPAYLTSNFSGITLRTSNRPIVFTVADRTKNYTISYYSDVLAWPVDMFTGITDAWLYIDINQSSSARRYGITTAPLTYGNVAPSNPVADQMWFDTSRNVMKSYNIGAASWINSIRIIAGHYTTTQVSSSGFGSQVGITGSNFLSGSIMVDGFGVAIKDSNSFFVTTEDTLMVDGASTYAAKLESNVAVVSANQPIAAFHVICYTNDGKARPADYDDVGGNIVGIATTGANTSEPLNVVLSGKVHNPLWAWGSANVTLWVGQNGELVAVDPFDVGGRAKRRVPVARTLDATTIIFDQGLGGVGEKGDSGDTVGAVTASATVRGVTKLSVEPADPTDPVAIGANDPILTEPRIPVEHTHPASSITVSPFGTFNDNNVQAALEYLQRNKLSLSGGTVIGAITSTVLATADAHLITLGQTKSLISDMSLSYKRYTLSAVPQSITIAFNLLTTDQRTFNSTTIVILEWQDSIYLWTAGGGAPVVAAFDGQFALISKAAIPTPPTTVKIVKGYTAYNS